ncbi:MAG: carboxyltransferase domain-containing protein [Pseudomonadota bacterium]
MTHPPPDLHPAWPQLRTAGVSSYVVSFADSLSEPANRAALAFRAAVDRMQWAGLEESSTSLVSTYLRYDPAWTDHHAMRTRLVDLLTTQNWFEAPLPEGRKLWHVPTVFGTDLAPQLAETAKAAGRSEAQAISEVTQNPLRVQTIGFAPGQPYLGELPANWDIPRQTALTPRVPSGALTVAIRQVVLFSVSAPTGWHHIGQTAFPLFRPDADQPFLLRVGDEVQFKPVSRDVFETLRTQEPLAGAWSDPLP